MKHLKNKLVFDQSDVEEFRKNVHVSKESTGWRVKFEGQYIICKGKSTWKNKKLAKSAFTRKYINGFAYDIREKYKNLIPYDVSQKQVLKLFEEYLVENKILEFVEIP